MKIEYQYFAENGFLISKPTGTITLKDLQNYTDELYNDKAIKSPFMEIVDLEHIDDFDFGYFEAEEVIVVIERPKENELSACRKRRNKRSKNRRTHLFWSMWNGMSTD